MATAVSTVTLAELKKRVREHADMVDSDFVSDESGDSELTRFIQQSYRKLYNKVVETFSDWYAEDPLEFTISSGNSYTLPDNFYKLSGVDFKVNNGKWVALQPFNFARRNMERTGLRWSPRIRYRLRGRKLLFIPTDDCEGDYRVWFIAKPTIPVDDTDEIEGENGWDEYVVLDAAIKCLLKEESDARGLMALRDEVYESIIINASTADEGGSETITDVHAEEYDEDLYY